MNNRDDNATIMLEKIDGRLTVIGKVHGGGGVTGVVTDCATIQGINKCVHL